MTIAHIEHGAEHLGEIELDTVLFRGPEAPESAVMRRVADDVVIATSQGSGVWKLRPQLLEAAPEPLALDIDPDDVCPYVPTGRLE